MHPTARAAATAYNVLENASELLEQADPNSLKPAYYYTDSSPCLLPEIRTFFFITEHIAMAIAHQLTTWSDCVEAPHFKLQWNLVTISCGEEVGPLTLYGTL